MRCEEYYNKCFVNESHIRDKGGYVVMVVERLIKGALSYLNYAGLEISKAQGDKTGLLDDAYDNIMLAVDSLNAWLDYTRRG